MTSRIKAIDAVVNLWTPEALALRSQGRDAFYQDKMRVSEDTDGGLSLEVMLQRMDNAGIEARLPDRASMWPRWPARLLALAL